MVQYQVIFRAGLIIGHGCEIGGATFYPSLYSTSWQKPPALYLPSPELVSSGATRQELDLAEALLRIEAGWRDQLFMIIVIFARWTTCALVKDLRCGLQVTRSTMLTPLAITQWSKTISLRAPSIEKKELNVNTCSILNSWISCRISIPRKVFRESKCWYQNDTLGV